MVLTMDVDHTNGYRHDSLRAPFFKISPYVWYEIGTKRPPDTNSTSISCETKVSEMEF